MKKITVEVTPYHIENGHPKSAELNPLVLALAPRLPFGETESTSDGWIQHYEVARKIVDVRGVASPRFVRGLMLAQFPLPPDAAEYDRRCAEGEKPKPASFEIEIPDLEKGRP